MLHLINILQLEITMIYLKVDACSKDKIGYVLI